MFEDFYTCNVCNKDLETQPCPECGGEGYVNSESMDFWGAEIVCSVCDGRGILGVCVDNKCLSGWHSLTTLPCE